MRRMYTTEGIQKIIDESIQKAFENDVELGGNLDVAGDSNITGDLNVTGDAKIFEVIVDKDGHKRFIEGNGVLVKEGYTPTYNKWSLSGTHLMLVIAGSFDGELSVTSGDDIARYDSIPQWINDKIFPLSGEENGAITRAVIYAVNDSGVNVGNSGIIYLFKFNSKLYINAGTTFTLGTAEATNSHIRIQFDLLIDNE